MASAARMMVEGKHVSQTNKANLLSPEWAGGTSKPDTLWGQEEGTTNLQFAKIPETKLSTLFSLRNFKTLRKDEGALDKGAI